VTDALWESHLAGEHRLGIVPIRDDNTVLFGAIDIDDYSVGVQSLAARGADLPLVVTRSKSGGAHFWIFFATPTSAAVAREWLTQAAIYLGYPAAEVFPKQSTLASKEDVGNWIHVPYFDASRTLCHGVAATGESYDLESWLAVAEASRVDSAHLEPPQVVEAEILKGAPPCLQTLARNGVPEGLRNKALFAFGVFAKKAHDPGWEDVLAQINAQFFIPPLPFGEVEDTIKALRKKNYFYPCSQQPIAGVCNKSICRTVEFGIGGTTNDPGIQIESITKVDSDPPYYFVQVNGVRIEVADSAALLNQVTFRKLVFERLDVIPSLIKEAAWAALINLLMKEAQHVDAPNDASTYGQFYFHLVNFCTSLAVARDKDEILMGRPWRDKDDIVWFRSNDLLAHLDRYKFRAYTSQKVWATLREHLKAKHDFWNIRGMGCNVWGVDMAGEHGQTEPFDIPEFEQGGDPMAGGGE
jgi:hypothetical protein